MKKVNLVLHNYGFFLASLFIYLIVISLFGFLDLFSYKVCSVISYIYIILLFFVCGIKIGNKSENKGYLSGLIIGSTNVLLMFILGIIFNSGYNVSVLIYYFTLILSSVIGGMIGINRKGSLD